MQRTKQLKNAVNNYIFSEHFYFDQLNQTQEILEKQKILIEVIDSNNVDIKDYIGIYEYDFEFIYKENRHTIDHSWVALANSKSDDFSKIRGFLRLSISILHDSDDRVDLSSQLMDNQVLSLPSQIKLNYKQITVFCYKAVGLPDMDSMFFVSKNKKCCDGYVKATYVGNEVTTSSYLMKGETLIWNEKLLIPCLEPTISNKLKLSIYDYDKTGDDLIGSFEINITDIKEGKYLTPAYINLYGGPTDTGMKKYVSIMNDNPKIGSVWKGKVLIKAIIEDSTNVKYICEKMTDNEKLKNFKESFLFEFDIHVEDVMFLPYNSEFQLIFYFQNQKVVFPLKKSMNNKITWNFNRKLQFYSSISDPKLLSDLFIYLVKGEKDISSNRICYQRLNCSFLFNENKSIIVKLHPDPSIGEIDDISYSGLVKCEINLRLLSSKENKVENIVETEKLLNNIVVKDDVNLNVVDKVKAPLLKEVVESDESFDLDKQVAELRKKKTEDKIKLNQEKTLVDKGISQVKDIIGINNESVSKKLRGKPYTIVLNLYMSRYLISGDDKGTSDLYVKASIDDQKIKSSIKWNLINAVWNECLIFKDIDIEINNQTQWPITFIEVLDKDQLTDDKLGYSYVWLSDSAYKINSLDQFTPKWEQLRLPKSNAPRGQILMSFYLIDQENKELIKQLNKIKIAPTCVNYTFEINVLGLRRLEPLGIIPIKKAYIDFDLQSLRVPEEEEIKKDKFSKAETEFSTSFVGSIKTEANELGSDPTINTVIKFGMKLPLNQIYTPDLQAIVYDSVLAGIVKDNLGVFLMEINKLRSESEVKLEQDIELCKKIISNPNITNTELEDINPFKKLENISKSYILLPNYKLLTIVNDIKETKGKEENKNNKKIVIEKADKTYLIEDETMKPDKNEFMELGFIKGKLIDDSKELDDLGKNIKNLSILDISNLPQKHYRKIIHRPLEEEESLNIKSPFLKIPLRRSKFEDKENDMLIFDSILDDNNKIIRCYYKDVSKQAENIKDKTNIINFIHDKEFGYFKGIARVNNQENLDQFNKTIQLVKDANKGSIPKQLHFLDCYEHLSKSIISKSEVVVRVYILNIYQLRNKDLTGKSDPYIKIILGNTIINEVKSYVEDVDAIDIYKCYELPAVLPGNALLKIQAWDFDTLFSDDLIGETEIDIEDRYFDEKWEALVHKPIETRPLLHSEEQGSQGYIKLWVEVFEKSERNSNPQWPISKPKEVEAELRLIIWEATGLPMLDIEGTSDVYFSTFLESEQTKLTDVHYRCQTGDASFNWRCIHKIVLPRNEKTSILNIQAFDKDFFNKDDYMCNASLDLSDILQKSFLLDTPMLLDKKEYAKLTDKEKSTLLMEPITKENEVKFEKEDTKKFWVTLKKANAKGESIISGTVLISLEILPMWKANLCKVGEGRDEPNCNPHLPPPIGRLEFSLNPFKMLNQCVGPAYRRKFYCLICAILYVFWCIFVLPYVVYYIGGQVASPYTWIDLSNNNSKTSNSSALL